MLSEVDITEDEELEVFSPFEGVDGWFRHLIRCCVEIRSEDRVREQSAGECAMEEGDDMLRCGKTLLIEL